MTSFNLKEILFRLTGESGVSGDESAAADTALKILKEYSKNAYIKNGNVIAEIKSDNIRNPKLVLDAHIDQVGFTVTHITDDGFIKLGSCGGIDGRILPAQKLIIHGKENIFGVICSTPPHLSSGESKVKKADEVYVDTGMDKRALEKLVGLGDKVSFCANGVSLAGNAVTSCALDDRAGMAAVIYALELAKGKKLKYNISVVFSTQEEVGERGAAIAAFETAPDLALAVDVSFALSPGEDEYKCGIMGNGTMIGYSPSLDSLLSHRLSELAEKQNIPFQKEIMGGLTSTNADRYSVSRSGVRTALLSVPLKYMHTPVEVVEIDDIQSTAKLIAEFITKGE